jgi:hypothetical protein
MTKRQQCVVCGETKDYVWNNAWPVAKGECCDQCAKTTVLDARIKLSDAQEGTETTCGATP